MDTGFLRLPNRTYWPTSRVCWSSWLTLYSKSSPRSWDEREGPSEFLTWPLPLCVHLCVSVTYSITLQYFPEYKWTTFFKVSLLTIVNSGRSIFKILNDYYFRSSILYRLILRRVLFYFPCGSSFSFFFCFLDF